MPAVGSLPLVEQGWLCIYFSWHHKRVQLPARRQAYISKHTTYPLTSHAPFFCKIWNHTQMACMECLAPLPLYGWWKKALGGASSQTKTESCDQERLGTTSKHGHLEILWKIILKNVLLHLWDISALALASTESTGKGSIGSILFRASAELHILVAFQLAAPMMSTVTKIMQWHSNCAESGYLN